jgi:fatty acid desaturase
VAPAVYTPGAKSGFYKSAGATVNEPLVTEGMKARQREIDKKRRVVSMLRQVENEEAEVRWGRARGWIYGVVAILAALGAYWRIQSVYGDRWPLLTVWVFLGTMLLAALFWLFWFLDYSD